MLLLPRSVLWGYHNLTQLPGKRKSFCLFMGSGNHNRQQVLRQYLIPEISLCQFLKEEEEKNHYSLYSSNLFICHLYTMIFILIVQISLSSTGIWDTGMYLGLSNEILKAEKNINFILMLISHWLECSHIFTYSYKVSKYMYYSWWPFFPAKN